MLPRRDFLAAASAVTAVSAVHATGSAQEQKNEATRPVRIGVMGLSRGLSLALDFAKLNEVEVVYLCDVDDSRASSAVNQFSTRGSSKPRAIKDFRMILDDPTIDALICAAPNHWHGPATVMACKAGKHVYVEKPCSHNPQEGEWMIAAANKFKRCVQMGTQRRSAAGTREAMQKIHSGAIGKAFLSRCYYTNLRGPVPKVAASDPPNQFDYQLWQGPAPKLPFQSNYVPYNWHWFWHWGGGELGNNGVHGLDLCRWGLQVDYPIRSVSSGGRYWYDDAQETPDTQTACFEFANGKQITWNATSCNKHRVDYFCSFYGDDGSLELEENGIYRIFNKQDKLVEEGGEKSAGQAEHLQNFIDCVRLNDPLQLHQPILEAHKSTLLCHLGNIAQRTGRTVMTDASNGHIQNDVQQQALWGREYDPAWKEAVSME